jgi:hypothetical protein
MFNELPRSKLGVSKPKPTEKSQSKLRGIGPEAKIKNKTHVALRLMFVIKGRI